MGTESCHVGPGPTGSSQSRAPSVLRSCTSLPSLRSAVWSPQGAHPEPVGQGHPPTSCTGSEQTTWGPQHRPTLTTGWLG